jgi:hypothetical protein
MHESQEFFHSGYLGDLGIDNENFGMHCATGSLSLKTIDSGTNILVDAKNDLLLDARRILQLRTASDIVVSSKNLTGTLTGDVSVLVDGAYSLQVSGLRGYKLTTDSDILLQSGNDAIISAEQTLNLSTLYDSVFTAGRNSLFKVNATMNIEASRMVAKYYNATTSVGHDYILNVVNKLSMIADEIIEIGGTGSSYYTDETLLAGKDVKIIGRDVNISGAFLSTIDVSYDILFSTPNILRVNAEDASIHIERTTSTLAYNINYEALNNYYVTANNSIIFATPRDILIGTTIPGTYESLSTTIGSFAVSVYASEILLDAVDKIIFRTDRLNFSALNITIDAANELVLKAGSVINVTAPVMNYTGENISISANNALNLYSKNTLNIGRYSVGVIDQFDISTMQAVANTIVSRANIYDVTSNISTHFLSKGPTTIESLNGSIYEVAQLSIRQSVGNSYIDTLNGSINLSSVNTIDLNTTSGITRINSVPFVVTVRSDGKRILTIGDPTIDEIFINNLVVKSNRRNLVTATTVSLSATTVNIQPLINRATSISVVGTITLTAPPIRANNVYLDCPAEIVLNRPL